MRDSGDRLTRRQAIQTTVGLVAGLSATEAFAVGRQPVPHEPGSTDSHSDGDRTPQSDLKLWYDKGAKEWSEALPIGNSRIAAMVFGGALWERFQLNEHTLWAGGPHDYDHPEAAAALPEIRRLIFAGEYVKAQELVDAKFIGLPAAQMQYQSVGSLYLGDPDAKRDGAASVTGYRRELDLDTAIARVEFSIGESRYVREAFVSPVDDVLAIRTWCDGPGALPTSIEIECPLPNVQSDTPHGKLLTGHGGDAGGVQGLVKFAASIRTVIDPVDSARPNRKAATVLVSLSTSYRSYATYRQTRSASRKQNSTQPRRSRTIGCDRTTCASTGAYFGGSVSAWAKDPRRPCRPTFGS